MIFNSHTFKVVGKDVYGTIPFNFDTDEQDVYFLLYVSYETGDSFGKSSGNTEFIGLYNDPKIAKENQQTIEDYVEHRKNDNWSVELWNSDGSEKYSYSTSAFTGYFEYVENIDVIPLMIKRG
ncbi:hypothetical protein [uncultured Arcobacter sp.]|uniref:hypothetical protein n=1 Tax=uncultured Arcobacter sp. TaxID=165434 RepID=UPI002634250E|nr:hypothetical protein [uncultured Arcobacter sp.]